MTLHFSNQNNNSDSHPFLFYLILLALVFSLAFFVVYLENFRVYKASFSFLFIPENEASAFYSQKINQNLSQIPRTFFFYNKIFNQNPFQNSLKIEKLIDSPLRKEQKEAWQKVIKINNIAESDIIEITIAHPNQNQANLISQRTIQILFETVNLYYNSQQKNISLRLVEKPITEPTISNWGSILALSFGSGLTVSFLINLIIYLLNRFLPHRKEEEKIDENGVLSSLKNLNSAPTSMPEQYREEDILSSYLQSVDYKKDKKVSNLDNHLQNLQENETVYSEKTVNSNNKEKRDNKENYKIFKPPRPIRPVNIKSEVLISKDNKISQENKKIHKKNSFYKLAEKFKRQAPEFNLPTTLEENSKEKVSPDSHRDKVTAINNGYNLIKKQTKKELKKIKRPIRDKEISKNIYLQKSLKPENNLPILDQNQGSSKSFAPDNLPIAKEELIGNNNRSYPGNRLSQADRFEKSRKAKSKSQKEEPSEEEFKKRLNQLLNGEEI